MESDHLGGRGVTWAVGIEAAVDFVVAGKQSCQPSRVGSDAGRGEADLVWVHLEATNRVDGRLAENDLFGTRGTDPEVAQVLVCTGRHTTPNMRAGSAQFRADRPVCFSRHQEKDRVTPAVRIQCAGFG